jgi:hypothetical protein
MVPVHFSRATSVSAGRVAGVRVLQVRLRTCAGRSGIGGPARVEDNPWHSCHKTLGDDPRFDPFNARGVHAVRPGAAYWFALRWKATQAVHHWRSTVLFAYSWQVQNRFGFEGSTHVVE